MRGVFVTALPLSRWHHTLMVLLWGQCVVGVLDWMEGIRQHTHGLR